MINSPIIPILVFILLVTPSVLIGFIRGWRASLFFALFNLALVGIEVAIGLAIYDSLWEMFKGFYLKDLEPGLNPESFKVSAKRSVITLFIGICMIFNYLLTLGIYLPLRNKLKKHLFPKTSSVNSNEKTIERSTHWVSRTSGVAIGTVSSLFFASFAASSVAVVTNTNNRYSGFNSFTSEVSNIYSFGNAGYDADFALAKNFASHELTPEMQSNLINLFYIGNKDGVIKNKINPELLNSIRTLSTGDMNNSLHKILSNKEILSIITKATLDSTLNSQKKIYLEDVQYKTHGKRLYSDTTSFLTKVSTIAQDLKFNLNDEVANKVIEIIMLNTIHNFKETGYYQQWEDGVSLINVIRQDITSLENGKRNEIANVHKKENELAKVYSDIQSFINNLKRIGASDKNNNYKSISKGDAINSPGIDNTLTNNGDAFNTKQRINTYETQKQQAKIEKDRADNAFVGSPGGTLGSGGVSKRHNELMGTFNQKDGLVQNKQSEINNKISSISWRTNSLNSYTDITNQIYATNTKINSNTNAIAKNRNEITSINLKIRQLDNEINANQFDLNEAQRDLNSHLATLRNYEAKIKTAQTELQTLNGQINGDPLNNKVIRRKISSKQNEITGYRQNVANFNGLVNGDRRKISTLTSKVNSLQAQKASMNNRIITLTNEIQNLTNENVKLNSDVNKLNELTRLKQELEPLIIDRNNARTSLKNYERNTYNPAKTEYDRRTALYNQASQRLNNEKDKLNKLNNEKVRIENNIISKIKERESLLTNIYSLSDKINKYDSLKPSAHTGERYIKSTTPMATHAYTNPTTDDYKKWSSETIPGAKDYLKHAIEDTGQFKSILDRAEIRYNKLLNRYKETLKTLLKK